MSVARPLAFLLVLAAVFGGAASLGCAVGPLERGTPADDDAGHGEKDLLRFETTFPSAGRYRAFLQFSAGGAVRTAEFTLEVPR